MNRGANRSMPVKRDMRKIILYASLGILAVVVIVAVALASRVPQSASTAPSFAHLTVGQSAPPFAVSTTAGPFDSSKVGKPIFLEVFATWCPHCQREVPVLDSLYKKYGDKVAFVSVSGSNSAMDGSSQASQADVIDFSKKFDVRYPIAFDPELDVAKKYLQGGFPTLVMIGGDGKVVYLDSGEVDEKLLAQKLAALK